MVITKNIPEPEKTINEAANATGKKLWINEMRPGPLEDALPFLIITTDDAHMEES